MLLCLDSNIIIDLFRGDESIKSKLASALESGDKVAITPIVLCELFKGAYLSSKQKESIELINSFVESVELLHFEHRACQLFGSLYFMLSKKGAMASQPDLMMASIAAAHNTLLVTRNKKHFEGIPNLNVRVW